MSHRTSAFTLGRSFSKSPVGNIVNVLFFYLIISSPRSTPAIPNREWYIQYCVLRRSRMDQRHNIALCFATQLCQRMNSSIHTCLWTYLRLRLLWLSSSDADSEVLGPYTDLHAVPFIFSAEESFPLPPLFTLEDFRCFSNAEDSTAFDQVPRYLASNARDDTIGRQCTPEGCQFLPTSSTVTFVPPSLPPK